MSLRDISDITRLGVVKKIIEVIDYFMSNDIDASRVKGQLDISNIPPAGLDNVIKVDTVTDMLALTVDDVQNGDTVMIIGVTPPVQYQVVDDTKLGTMDAFQEYAAGTATKALADINGNNIHTTYGKLAGNNTWTGNNYWDGSAIFNANLTIRGSQGQIILGNKPQSATVQANIISSTTGALNYIATENAGHYFRIGKATASTSITTNDSETAILSHNAFEFARITHDGVAKWLGNANTATKLATARTITANLASSTAGSFDGSANITVGVTGTLPIANGGTGLTSAPSMLVNLASTTATSPLQASPRPGVTGTLPIANGGTGQTTAAGVRNALGLGNTTEAVPIANGGTGATTAAAARTALGCAPAYTYSTTDLIAGSSALTTGTLYIVYE